MKTRNRIFCLLLAVVMVLSVMPFSVLNVTAEGTHTVTLYANDGLGTQTQVNVSEGLYVLPECDFTPPPEMTFLAWAIGSESGEQKQPGAAINVTADTLVVAIWTESAAMYETRPGGGVTGVNGTFDIRYRLNIQPESIWLQFYNDYQGKWTDNFCMATMPEYEGALTHFDVPTIHKDTEETVLFRLAAYKDGVAYYSNTFAVTYTNNRFTKQPEDAMLSPGKTYEAKYAMSFTPSEVTVEYLNDGAWMHYSNADANGVSLSAGDGEKALTFRIRAIKDGDAYYSREFKVKWCEITEVSTWEELHNAVNADKGYIKLVADIKDVVPEDELPTVHRLKFDGGKDYVLDLNEHSLIVLNHINEYYSADVPMISVSGGSSLEIKDGSLTFDNWGAGGSKRKARGVVHVQDTSALVANRVIMKNAYAGTVVSATANASVNLNGGEYIVQNGFAIYLDRQASLTLDGGVYIHTIVGDSANTQYVDGYGALYSESTGKLEINHAFFKSGVQINASQIGAFSTSTHEVTVNGEVLSEDIFVGTSTEAKNQNKKYYWYSYTQYALEKVDNGSFSNAVIVISYEKKYPIDVVNGTAMVGGTPVTEAAYGQTVTVVADTPEQGMEFVRWGTAGTSLSAYYSPTTTFTMGSTPVTLAAYYGKEKVKTVSATVGKILPGQKAYDTQIIFADGVYLQAVEWREEGYKMDEDDIFKAGKTYSLKMLIYPPDECLFADSVTATVDGKSETVSAQEQYAYVDYTFEATESVGFSIVYAGESRLGVGGEILLDTALMASQSASFKSALDADKVTYQWYRNGEVIEGATQAVYNLTAEDAGGRFYVVVTADGKTNYGHHLNCGSSLYQLYLNATEIVAGGKVPLMSSATPGVSIDAESLVICEVHGNNSYGKLQSVAKAILIPGKRYRLLGKIIEQDGVTISEGANIYINGELMADKLDANRFFYEFDVPAADYDVYYTANGEIGIGVTLSVDIEKMCQESPAFKHACEAANPTYQTVFYQWYRNGEAIKDATGTSYTVTTADKDSLINCVVTLVDGKFGVGEQQEITNVITVLNVNIPYPKNGEARIMSGISADGVTLFKILWIHKDTGVTMQGDDVNNEGTHKYAEGEVYEYLMVFSLQDGFKFDVTGNTTAEMTIAYIYGEKIENAGLSPNEISLYGEVTAIHQHQYSDNVWDHHEYGHWQPCIVPGCPDPNEEWMMHTDHAGGTATCQAKGECAICGAEYLAEHDFAVPDYQYVDDMKCANFCEHCDVWSDWSYHEGGVSDCQHKAVCDICHHEYGKLAACAGGKATCLAKAVCATCGEAYGELGGHSFGEWIAEIPATTDATGTKGHKDCAVCNKHFDLDGNELADLTIEQLEEEELDTNPEQGTDADEADTSEADTKGETDTTETDTNEADTTVAGGDKNSDGDDDAGLPVGAVVGIVAGSVVVLGGGGFALFWFVIKKKSFADLLAVFKKS